MCAACVLQVRNKYATVACNSLAVADRAKVAWTVYSRGLEHLFGVRCVVACSRRRDDCRKARVLEQVAARRELAENLSILWPSLRGKRSARFIILKPCSVD